MLTTHSVKWSIIILFNFNITTFGFIHSYNKLRRYPTTVIHCYYNDRYAAHAMEQGRGLWTRGNHQIDPHSQIGSRYWRNCHERFIDKLLHKLLILFFVASVTHYKQSTHMQKCCNLYNFLPLFIRNIHRKHSYTLCIIYQREIISTGACWNGNKLVGCIFGTYWGWLMYDIHTWILNIKKQFMYPSLPFHELLSKLTKGSKFWYSIRKVTSSSFVRDNEGNLSMIQLC